MYKNKQISATKKFDEATLYTLANYFEEHKGGQNE